MDKRAKDFEEDDVEDGDFEEADDEIVNQFFWSLVVQPGKKYTQTLPYNLHINHVSLEESAKDGSKSVLFCETDDGVSHPICTLRAGVNDQMSLNLLFPSDGHLCLRSSPNSAVIHLLGYCEELESPSDIDEDDEESQEEYENEDEEDEVQINPIKAIKDGKRKAEAEVEDTPAKKAKVEAPSTPVPPPKKKETSVPKSQSQPSVAQPPKTPEKKEVKKEVKKEAAPSTPKAKQETKAKEENLGVQKKLGMGVVYVVSQRGQGAKATPGKKVHVQYRGWLKNSGKEFDKGKIQFRLGLGEVIKGWDIGVEGMQVGEKRTLTIPASAGYGKRGAPPSIPPNADLQFDVTLINVQ